MNQIDNFRQLLIHQMQDMLDHVSQAAHLYEKMAEVARAEELRETLRQGGQRIQEHRKLLRESLKSLQAQERPETCRAMIGMIEEGNHVLDMIDDPYVRDAALVVIAQKVQAYGIAGYGCIRAHAEQLSQSPIVNKIQRILQDEKKLDKRLSAIAESSVNERALAHT